MSQEKMRIANLRSYVKSGLLLAYNVPILFINNSSTFAGMYLLEKIK